MKAISGWGLIYPRLPLPMYMLTMSLWFLP
nr:MAG TPA: hypothetical protein [Caudoviricetes sp.]